MRLKKFRASIFGRPLERLYTKIPSIPNSIKYGKIYKEQLKFLESSQWFSEESLKKYQLFQIKQLLSHAFLNVPYYKEIFKCAKFDLNCFNNLDDFQQIPILTKDIVKKRTDDLISSQHKNSLHYVSTSGSTGTPLKYYWEKEVTNNIENAYLWHLWNWYKVKPYDRFLVLRTEVFSDDKIYNYKRNNYLSFSIYQLNDKNFKIFAREINKFHPQVIQAFPSALFLFTKLLIRNNFEFPSKVKVILTSSENLYECQESLFNSYYNCLVGDLYGNTERSVLINRCEKNSYHIIPQYAYTELINRNGERCTKDGQVGQIISTSFNNYAMPLIRYKTGDLAEYSSSRCSCGRSYPTIKKIVGREQDFIVKKDNTLINIAMVTATIHNNLFEKIDRFQFYQDTKGIVNFNIVKKQEIPENEIKTIHNELTNRIGANCIVKINPVDCVQITDRGKQNVLIQKLPLNFD